MLDDFIYVIDDVVPPELCAKIIEKFENDQTHHVSGQLGESHQSFENKSYKDSTELCISSTPGWEKADIKVRYYILKAIDKYLEHLRSLFENSVIKRDDDVDFVWRYNFTDLELSMPTIQRICKGRRYNWHNDTDYAQRRVFTTLLYLNTLEPHEGGTTDFINGVSVRPVAGKLVIFPAVWPYFHTGRLIHADLKYLIVTNVFRP